MSNKFGDDEDNDELTDALLFDINEEGSTDNISPEEVQAVYDFMHLLGPELAELGSNGEVMIDYDNKKIIAVGENGVSKEFSFDQLQKKLKESLH